MSNKTASKSPYSLSTEEIYREFLAGEDGLKSYDIPGLREQYGYNRLKEKKKESLLTLFIDQLTNPIIYLLTGAVIVSLFFNDIAEAIAIVIVIILNTVIGFWMEFQARKSVNALKKLDKLVAHVKRDGKSQKVDAEELVPGDVILLEAGDVIAADARIITSSELKVDESPLTGESIPIEKSSEQLEAEKPLSDQSNMLFRGTAVKNGKAQAVVTSIGIHTEIGKVSEMVDETGNDEIPLNRKLNKLSYNLIWIIVVFATAFSIFGWIAGKEIYLLLQTSIAWTVAAIPEGLTIVASIALARGMLRLARQHVIVKKLEAVETLGETTVIFTDKTGTLTKNQLTVHQIISPSKETEVEFNEESKKVSLHPEDSLNNSNFQHIYKISVFCNDAEWLNEKELKGDQLDASLLRFTKYLHPDNYEETSNHHRIHEDPFDSEAKFMGTAHQTGEQLYIAGKGAAESILNRSKFILENDENEELTDSVRKQWLEKNDELSADGLRIIAYAYREEENDQLESLQKEDDFVKEMTFVGFVGFIDPARKEVRAAIDKCHEAGIKVVMVTGDHPGIARNIGQKVNLTNDTNSTVLEGKHLAENESKIAETLLFARVNPRQKLDIVEHFKNRGEITAMTGDGINDTPALKKADIGIAMGQKGTQAAQEVADMILKNDSFAAIVDAVEQGRIIFGNIRKFVVYQLSYHLAEILIIAGISFTLFYLPLLPLQILFLNLLSDVFPALALGLGKGDESIMKQKPKKPEEPILNRKNWIATFTYGITMAVIITGTYLLAMFHFNESKEVVNTITFFALAFSQLLHVFNMRDPEEKIFNNQILRNKYVWAALAICSSAMLAAYAIPAMREILSFQQLTGQQWALVAGSSISTLVVIQLIKKIFNF